MTAHPKNLRLTATSTFGLEAVVQRELRSLGFDDITTADGRLSFAGNVDDICRCNLWLRSADRVMLEIAQFEATDFGQLFDQTNELPWEDWIGKTAAFPGAREVGQVATAQRSRLPTHCEKSDCRAIEGQVSDRMV